MHEIDIKSLPEKEKGLGILRNQFTQYYDNDTNSFKYKF